jgi:hypothetical protein
LDVGTLDREHLHHVIGGLGQFTHHYILRRIRHGHKNLKTAKNRYDRCRSDKSLPIEITFSLATDRLILQLLCRGWFTKLIAYEVGLTPPTVAKRKRAIAKRAKVTVGELVIWALQNPACLARNGRCTPGLHPAACPCDSPYCRGMRRAA